MVRDGQARSMAMVRHGPTRSAPPPRAWGAVRGSLALASGTWTLVHSIFSHQLWVEPGLDTGNSVISQTSQRPQGLHSPGEETDPDINSHVTM